MKNPATNPSVPTKRRRLSKVTLGILLLVALGLIWGFLQSRPPASTIHYGSLEGNGPFKITWPGSSDHGILELTDTGATYLVTGDPPGREAAKWSLTPLNIRSEETETRVTWPDGWAPPATGTWESKQASQPKVIELTQKAGLRESSRQSGIRLGSYGRTKQFDFLIEKMPDLQPWHAPFYDSVETKMTMAGDQCMKGAFKEAWEGIRTPSAGNVWEDRFVFTLVYSNERCLSYQGRYTTYSGGAHANLIWKPINAYLPDGESEVRFFQLSDLFQNGNQWSIDLLAICTESLRAQGASAFQDPKAGTLNWGDLHAFTFDAQALTIHFAPYQAGSYAEGSFSVRIPATTLLPHLTDSAPAQTLRALWGSVPTIETF